MNTKNCRIDIQNSLVSDPSFFSEEDELNILDFLTMVLKHKKMIVIACASAFTLTCGITLLMPNMYTSTARILPPKESAGGLSGALSGISDIASLTGLSLNSGTGEQYVGMLKSRTISDTIINKFELMEVYDNKYRFDTYIALNDHIQIEYSDENGIIAINVEDEDPKRAASIANGYIDELKKLNVELNLGTAGRERIFLENRLSTVKSDLLKAEENLKFFQEKNKAIRIDDQATAIIDAFANLKAEIASREVQLGVLLSYQTDQNPHVRVLREQITQLESQLEKLEKNKSENNYDLFIATSDVPELAFQYARILRDYKIQESLFEIITKQYEMAKISEARDTSTIQVLDEAVIPDKKSKPRRAFIVLISTAIFGLAAVFFALFLEFFNRLREQAPNRWKLFCLQIPFMSRKPHTCNKNSKSE